MLYAVVMAGGAGTRFWPESRADRPKQLMRLTGDRTMLQATLDRLAGVIPAERVLIATSARLASAVAAQLPELTAKSILAEPCKRDTAPCVGLAALQLLKRDPNAVMLVCPSDHLIQPTHSFQAAVQLAERLVSERPTRLITFGIRPTYPAETFGYIERGETLPTSSGEPAVYRVRRFHEKPNAEQARRYLETGAFYWNAGIFVWNAATIRDWLVKRQPEMMAHLQAIAAAAGSPEYGAILNREFAAIRPISIDYAVMEHADDVLVIEAPFAWDDVGSWQALARIAGANSDGNTIQARHVGLHTRGTIVRGPVDHLIVTLGVQDLIVVHTPDATLVANKHDEESIRQLARLLEERGLREYL
jgi:mannose-1-phosphate guanylyltransferase